MADFPTFKGSWPWLWPWIGSYCITSCISRRPVGTYQISLKSKKLFVDGWTYGRTYGRAGEHLRPTLLGQLGGVDLKIVTEINWHRRVSAKESAQRCSDACGRGDAAGAGCGEQSRRRRRGGTQRSAGGRRTGGHVLVDGAVRWRGGRGRGRRWDGQVPVDHRPAEEQQRGTEGQAQGRRQVEPGRQAASRQRRRRPAEGRLPTPAAAGQRTTGSGKDRRTVECRRRRRGWEGRSAVGGHRRTGRSASRHVTEGSTFADDVERQPRPPLRRTGWTGCTVVTRRHAALDAAEDVADDDRQGGATNHRRRSTESCHRHFRYPA